MNKILKKIAVLGASILLSLIVCAGEGEDTRLRIVFAGDIMGHDSQIQAALVDSNGTYDYSDCFRDLKPYLDGADIAVGNLEPRLSDL